MCILVGHVVAIQPTSFEQSNQCEINSHILHNYKQVRNLAFDANPSRTSSSSTLEAHVYYGSIRIGCVHEVYALEKFRTRPNMDV